MGDWLTLGRWRRRRALARQLRALDGQDWQHPFNAGAAAARPRPVSGDATRMGRQSYVALAALATVALLVWRLGGAGVGMPLQYDGAPTTAPPTSAAPLGAAPPAPPGEGGYAFLQLHEDGTPVAFDPCRELRYVVRPDGAPAGGHATLVAAMAELSARTGLRIVYEGVSSEGPQQSRETYQPERYGDRWAPVLVAWADPSEAPLLTGDVAAYAGPQLWGTHRAGSTRYVSGQVVIGRGAYADLGLLPDGTARQQNLLLHELGHLVGLDHVSDPRQVMYDQSVEDQFGYREGDLRGLALLGAGPCFTDR
jgi:hypothetical protein